MVFVIYFSPGPGAKWRQSYIRFKSTTLIGGMNFVQGDQDHFFLENKGQKDMIKVKCKLDLPLYGLKCIIPELQPFDQKMVLYTLYS